MGFWPEGLSQIGQDHPDPDEGIAVDSCLTGFTESIARLPVQGVSRW